MRIACISTSTVPSRTANSMQLMKACQALLELGHTVRLWVPSVSEKVGWEELTPHYGIRGGYGISRLVRLPSLRGYDFCARAVRDARRWRADLLYVWPYQAAAYSSWLKLPTLLELHDRPAGVMGPLLLRAFFRGRGVKRVLYTTHGLREAIQSLLNVELEQPLAIHAPNGTDLEQYRDLPPPTDARRELGLPNRFTVGYTGHLYAGRGLDMMLDLARRNPELMFLWAGGNPQEVDAWNARAVAEGIDNLELLGFVPNTGLPLVQAACEVLLMPYEHTIAVSSGGDTAQTASPMKLFEYMASGRAILSSDLPVIREVLNPRNAVLLPPEDTAAWSSALQRLAREPHQRETLGRQAREDAAQYTWKRRAERALEGFPEAHREA
jgi:glycosyltransferase involved in cell wall biosynthesis